jgi:hypothetical protein
VGPAADHRAGAAFVVEFPALARRVGEPDGTDGSSVAAESTDASAGRRSLSGV